MYTTISINDDGEQSVQKLVQVATDRIKQSELFANMLDQYGSDTILTFPQQYNDVADTYIKFINDDTSYVKDVKSPTILKLCFELCHFISHQQFFNFLMEQLFSTWSLNSKIINDMGDNLQREIYLCCPYFFLPISYQTNLTFLKFWIPNNNTTICVEGKYYFAQCTFDNKVCDTKHLRIIDPKCSKIQNTEFVTHGTSRIWSPVNDDNGQQILVIEDNFVHGLCINNIQYHNNGQVGEINYYDSNGSGKIIKVQAFYPSGMKYAEKCIKRHT